jgi:alpha-amylase
MIDIVFAFEVHQPFRVKRSYFWEKKVFQHLTKKEMFDYYFDTVSDKEIFDRASRKCYFPTNRILLNLIDQYRKEKKKVKIAFSLSGVFLDQCERFNKDVLESFKQLAETGCTEFLEQTYFHSLCSLYPMKDEFVEEVMMHRQAMRDLLGLEPEVFENTELLYNNAIAKAVEKLGYSGIYMEGVERVLENRSPNYVYEAENCEKLRILMRNYKLTDDIGFRFSSRRWPEWPLTADKFASWLASTPGECVNIFPDYETFGEHHWPETGIQEFLTHLFPEILRYEHLNLETPSKVITKHEPVDKINVPDLGAVSWADLARDTSCWLGNTMQWAYFTTVRDMKPLVRESQDPEFSRIWRYFQVSDHLYYMFTAGGTPGEVHSYFSPYGNPVDAFITCQSAVTDFESRLKLFAVAANEPFKFSTTEDIDLCVWSLKGFIDAISTADIKSIEFHNDRGDFENWALYSIRDKWLAREFAKISGSELEEKELRAKLSQISKKRFEQLHKKARAIGYF